ncbi:hypothetical protein [Campylobacter sp. MIT 97-5078]|uniref:hypothetical protein n=1 Tax=Campylobacter sp. MIT 97-5078 TaxID=1548153 RepID=UPI000513E05B|nr:hypothetical protein [Campylobacter sp. MIT 97-5078]KGI55302.1 hypothetical protein LR59_12645 [Campylobacter sp. MIT 97-5078]TQR25572.1 hypothetical protein DMB91_07145 [Campylobacter sp. MIT 97-5078]
MIKNRGLKIVLDEEKVLREGKYKLEDLYKYLDEVALEAELIRLDKNHYACRGDKDDLNCLMDFTFEVVEKENITRNVKQWYWFEGGKFESNIVEISKRDGIGVWQ